VLGHEELAESKRNRMSDQHAQPSYQVQLFSPRSLDKSAPSHAPIVNSNTAANTVGAWHARGAASLAERKVLTRSAGNICAAEQQQQRISDFAGVTARTRLSFLPALTHFLSLSFSGRVRVEETGMS
jgi:hypothetical protein